MQLKFILTTRGGKNLEFCRSFDFITNNGKIQVLIRNFKNYFILSACTCMHVNISMCACVEYVYIGVTVPLHTCGM